MKIFRNVFMMAAAMLIGFASCDNDPVDSPVDGPIVPAGSSIRLQFDMGSGATTNSTRALTESQTNTPVVVNGGFVLLTNIVGNIIAAQPVGAITVPGAGYVPNPTPLNNNTTVTFENIPAQVRQAHFVGNHTGALLTALNIADAAGFVGMPLSQVSAVFKSVASQSNANSPLNAVSVWGTAHQIAPRVPAVVSPTTGNVLHEATIYVNPIVARVEIFNITGNVNIADFRVEGVFIDSYFEQYSVSFGPNTALTDPLNGFRVRGTGADGTGALFAPQSAGGAFLPVHTGVTYDWHGTGAAALVPQPVPNTDPVVADRGLLRVVPPTGQVWGYNLFAGTSTYVQPTAPHPTTAVGRTVGGTATPRIAIRLSNVVIYSTYDFNWTHIPNPAEPLVTEARSLAIRVRVPHFETRTENAGWVVPNNITIGETVGGVLGNNLLNIWYNETDLAARQALMQAHFNGKYTATDVPSFISIRGFLHGGEPLDANNRPIPNTTTGFIPRMVYQLGGAAAGIAGGRSWTFGPENITIIPFEEDIDVEVRVVVQSWVGVGITPAGL